MSVTDSTISGNSAGRDGGGIYAHDGNVTMTSSTISGNSAGGDLRRSVEDLGEPHRTAVLLYYWMESPVEEIAALLRTRPATVRSYLFRARSRLRDTLGERV